MHRIVFSIFVSRQKLPVQLVSASTKLRQMFYRQIERRSFHTAWTRSGPAHNSPKPSLQPNQLNAGDASVTGAEQKTGPSAPSPTLSFGLV